MPELCKWLHEQLGQLPIVGFPLKLEQLPFNGIYFFYEAGETWGHGGGKSRIVRIGTSRDGNFRNRIAEHYLLKESSMDFDISKPAPHDRSIFRKNIGRVLLNRARDDYLGIWNIDFTTKKKREQYGYLRDIQKEANIESNVTKLLRQNFCFRFIIVDSKEERLELEKALIGTVAQCTLCKPSGNWLGNDSPDEKVKEKGLWQKQQLEHRPLSDSEMRTIFGAIRRTQQWIKSDC